ncbi:MAG: BadF/BadG/BcrA/BcrD ATPase family protein, partial [Fimbriimonadaceae bacterium]
MLFLGIDGGGSTCRAVVIDEFDKTVFQGQGGASNFSSTPARTLRRSVARALEAAPKVDQICGCFAGLINSEARDRARELVGTLLPDCPITLTADYAAALRASPPDTTACLIAGTGSIVCSITPEGYVKSGGGGPLLGD